MHKDKQSTEAGFHFKVKGEGRGGAPELWIFPRCMGIWNKKTPKSRVWPKYRACPSTFN